MDTGIIDDVAIADDDDNRHDGSHGASIAMASRLFNKKELLMLTTSHNRGPAAAIAWLCAAFASVSSLDTSAADGGEIDEIVVTATRRPVASDSVSTPISVIDVSAGKLGPVTDALGAQSGVFLQQTTPGQGAAIVRGLKGSAVLHLVDGMRLNNAIFRNAPTQYLALVPSESVERMELVRGTPASLYGSDAIGGVINVITRTPEFSSDDLMLRGDTSLSLSSAELGRRVAGTVEFGNAMAAATVSAAWQDTGNRRTGGGSRLAFGEYMARSLGVVVAVTPSDSHRWRLNLQSEEQPATPRVDALIAGFGQTEPASEAFEFTPNRRFFAHASYDNTEGALGLNWSVDAAWQRIDDDRTTRDFGADQQRQEDNRSDLLGLTTSASYDNGINSWIVGGEFYHDRVASQRRERDILTGDSAQLTSRFPDGAAITTAAAFANGARQITETHRLQGGLRYTQVSIDVPRTSVTPETTIDLGNISADLGWRWQLGDSLTLVGNVGAGFRAPNIFDLGTFGNRPGNRFNVANTDLDAEHVLQADAGLRYRSDSISGQVVLYRLRFDDRITSVLTGEVTADGRDIVQSVNAAQTDINGIEARVTITLSERLRSSLYMDYSRGEQRVGADSDEPADRMPPMHGEWRFTYTSDSDHRFDGWLQFASRQDRLSARDVGDSRINPEGTPGWAIVGVSWQADIADGWSLSVTANNLLDNRFRRHGSGIDAAGRDMSATLQYRWQ
ncbi:MAG: TonB-dependent receptor [Pseudomonadota bacterium]